MYSIYLASGSPRRQELLRQLAIHCDVVLPKVLEEPTPGETAADYVRRLARAKAHAGLQTVRDNEWPDRSVLGADTEVVLDGVILGKPRDRAHGITLLAALAGRTHEVLTAICVINGDRVYEALSESRVTFAELTPAEIARYWDTGEPADKAGGYAIQGRAAAFITRIEGSYSGIVGLPLYELSDLLKRTDRDAKVQIR